MPVNAQELVAAIRAYVTDREFEEAAVLAAIAADRIEAALATVDDPDYGWSLDMIREIRAALDGAE